MRRPLLTLPAILLAAPALAHPGHLAGLAGHDHWVAGAAIGAAIAVGLWGALKGRGRKSEDETPAEESTDEGSGEGSRA